MFHRALIILFLLTGILLVFVASLWAGPLESLLPKKDLPEGWAMIEGPQPFTKKTLFEHIDGEAELFLKYGFQNSVFAVFQNKKNREHQIELDIYDLGNVLQAFGVFSRFRNEDRPGGFGLDSYLDELSAFFYLGRYFVMLHALEPNRETLRQLSKLVSSKISDPSPPPREIAYFPKNGLKPGSIQYFPEGLLGHRFLERGFQGTYAGKTEFKLFLATFQNSQKASNALKAFKDDLSKKGKVSSGGLIEFETRALKGEDPYQGRVMVAQKGSYLLGIVGFEKEEEGENRLAEFMRQVK
jgi:uncharacterized protein DUF6599